jgi:hypothetical protein
MTMSRHDKLSHNYDAKKERCFKLHKITSVYSIHRTASVIQWSDFLATDPEVPSSIPGATRLSEK